MKQSKKELGITKVGSGKADRVYYMFCRIIIGILTLLVLYPIIYVISASFS